VANRQAKAIRCLIEADMASDSIPIARSTIEFSLSAAALSRDCCVRVRDTLDVL
jgi:hypothetical protein